MALRVKQLIQLPPSCHSLCTTGRSPHRQHPRGPDDRSKKSRQSTLQLRDRQLPEARKGVFCPGDPKPPRRHARQSQLCFPGSLRTPGSVIVGGPWRTSRGHPGISPQDSGIRKAAQITSFSIPTAQQSSFPI